MFLLQLKLNVLNSHLDSLVIMHWGETPIVYYMYGMRAYPSFHIWRNAYYVVIWRETIVISGEKPLWYRWEPMDMRNHCDSDTDENPLMRNHCDGWGTIVKIWRRNYHCDGWGITIVPWSNGGECIPVILQMDKCSMIYRWYWNSTIHVCEFGASIWCTCVCVCAHYTCI